MEMPEFAYRLKVKAGLTGLRAGERQIYTTAYDNCGWTSDVYYKLFAGAGY
jgi:hypothetical protein